MNKLISIISFICVILCVGCSDNITNVKNVTYTNSYYSCVGSWYNNDTTYNVLTTIMFNSDGTWEERVMLPDTATSTSGTYIQNVRSIEIFDYRGSYRHYIMKDSVKIISDLNYNYAIFNKS
jgi:hypothetical protein